VGTKVTKVLRRTLIRTNMGYKKLGRNATKEYQPEKMVAKPDPVGS